MKIPVRLKKKVRLREEIINKKQTDFIKDSMELEISEKIGKQ